MRRPAAGAAATVIAAVMILFAVRAMPAGSASAGADRGETRACAMHCGWLAGLADGRVAAALSIVGSFGSLRCTPAGSFHASRAGATPTCQEWLSYAVYELRRSRVGSDGLTIIIAGRWGQSGMSSVVLDAAGVAGLAAARFDAAIQPQSTTFSAPAITVSAPGQLVLGLYANYSHASDAIRPPPGWHPLEAATVNTANCAGAAIDWSQPARGAAAAAITDSTAEYHYGGTIALDP